MKNPNLTWTDFGEYSHSWVLVSYKASEQGSVLPLLTIDIVMHFVSCQNNNIQWQMQPTKKKPKKQWCHFKWYKFSNYESLYLSMWSILHCGVAFSDDQVWSSLWSNLVPVGVKLLLKHIFSFFNVFQKDPRGCHCLTSLNRLRGSKLTQRPL